MKTDGSDTTRRSSHFGLPVHEVVLLLETDPLTGLTTAEAARRIDIFGANELPVARRTGPILRMVRQLQSPLIYILLAAAVTTFVLKELVDAAVIFGVVAANAIVGFIQESKAEASLDSLRSMISTRARVVRDGGELQLDSRELVPGDLVLIEAGDKVAADLRIVATSGLEADESALTGESLPVGKDEVVLPEATAVADRRNMLYSGTLITAGSGAGVAVETGTGTELGNIHRLVGSAESLATPLTRKLAQFSKVLTIVILGLAAVTFAIGVAQGRDASDTFTAAVALAVGAIPEGLPAAVTITLAIGVSRMARRGAVIRRMPAVETLGSTTVICSDKTGTLTQNQMTVRTVWTPDRVFSVSGTGYGGSGGLQQFDGAPVSHTHHQALHWCLVGGLSCNDATLVTAKGQTTLLGDPTEGAMLAVARRAGIERVSIAEQFPRTATLPFSSERQFMATVNHDRATDRHLVFVKGAAERVVELCGTQMSGDGSAQPLEAAAAHAAATALASAGLRVLATAMCIADGPDAVGESDLAGRLVLTGFQAMLDPPRPAARSAVEACRSAGIHVKMITGDHVSTATAIAQQVGIIRDNFRTGDILTGLDLEALEADAYPDAVSRATVFARVTPEQKLRLVRALQARHHVVAMTGDGVNDAPALQQADIGIAMGVGGTEVAKEAAAMVLTDDDFATIEAAVEEGRGVFDNLTKFIVWTLPTNMGEGLVILVAILAGGLLPILPTQILWINMTTAVALGLMLAFEPKEPAIMTRPPRDPRQPLLTGDLVGRTVLVSALLVAGAWWLFGWEISSGALPAEARTATVNLFVTVQVFYLVSCRSLTQSAWRIGLLSNRWLTAGIAVQLLLQLALTYLPFMNTAFETAPIGGQAWLRILGIALLTWTLVGVDKHLRASHHRTTRPIPAPATAAPHATAEMEQDIRFLQQGDG